MTSPWREILPVPKPAPGRGDMMVQVAYGDYGAEIPRHVAARICDLRFEYDGTVWGLRCRDDEWVELTAHGAKMLPPAQMMPLDG